MWANNHRDVVGRSQDFDSNVLAVALGTSDHLGSTLCVDSVDSHAHEVTQAQSKISEKIFNRFRKTSTGASEQVCSWLRS